MRKAIAWYRERTELRPGEPVPALDGLRFLMVFSVAAFHLWQQSWLTPSFSWLGRFVSLDPWLRTGYLWVDGMLLLSGFLLYLPFARAREAGRQPPGFSGFYRRRFCRIVPTYVLNLLAVFLLVALPERRYADAWAALRDWTAHLTFTHPLFAFSTLGTPLNGVLWTLGVEVQFYLLFPLLARAFRRMPLVTYLGMASLAFAFRAFAAAQPSTVMLVNQLPGFLDVYANGLLAAAVFARLEKTGKDDGLRRAFMTAVLLAALVGLAALVREQALQGAGEAIRRGQMGIRFTQSALTALAFIGASLGASGVRLLLGNRVTAFLAAVSFQFYMWHQVVALQLKTWRVPPSASQNPHMAQERAWQIPYLLLALGLTLAISALITYLVERPVFRRCAKTAKA